MSKTFLNEGDKVEIQGSGKKPYIVRKIGGVVDCSCPAWRNLGGPIDVRVCKHIKANIDPACLLPQAQNIFHGGVTIPQVPVNLPKPGLGVPMTVAANAAGVNLTRTGKVSTAVKAPVIKATEPPCLLAHKWDNEDPTGWWMSEKMDGVRAWWDGTKFISRLGNEYHAPAWFTADIPKMVLDGELFVGRKRFQETVSYVRKLVPDDAEWKHLKFVVFDAPEAGGPFENRMKVLKKEITDNLGPDHHVSVAEQVLCKNLSHMEKHLDSLLEKGAEGVMLRQPGSLYESGRSGTCLKVKKFFDNEATVIGHTDGRGKHKGRIGALICKWQGVEFEVGTGLSDKEREIPPAIGSKITFRYQELTDAGVPRFPVYVGERDYE